MKKIIIFTIIISIVFAFCSCSKTTKNEQQSETTTSTTTETTSKTFIPYDNGSETSTTKQNQNNSSASATHQNSTTAPAVSVPATESKAVTYYSENPNNKYIRTIVNKYGVDAGNLVALIRTKADNPGATVLEFTGEKDSSGNLIKTESTLKYVYEVTDSGSVKRASGQKTGNIGYSYVESYVNYNLAVKYIIPELDTMKKERTYENYFSN